MRVGLGKGGTRISEGATGRWACEEGKQGEEEDASGSLSGEGLHQPVGPPRSAGMR